MVLEKAKNTIRRYKLIKEGDRIVMGVSGGPDSVALLYLLDSLKKEYKLKLYIAHLDHMLRKESQLDMIFVENLAKKLKIPIITAKINIKNLNTRGSLEETARNVRLDFLFKVAKDTKSTKIALGHNLDDQAETVLMRILRGSGLYGLSGIAPKRRILRFTIIRPLIEVYRREIEKFLRQKKIKSCIDKTNFKDIYLRNKIRNKLLPLLAKEYNKNIKEVLSNLAENSACDYTYLETSARRITNRLGTRINLVRFLRLHPAMQRMILRFNIARLKGNTRRITSRHIKEIEDLILNRPINSIVDLPKGISVAKKKKVLYFYLRRQTQNS